MDWFLYYDVEVIRVNENDKIQFVSLSSDENDNMIISILINDKEYTIDNHSVYWSEEKRGSLPKQ